MAATGLQLQDLANYPPLARRLAEQHTAVLGRLPVILAAVLLSQISNYDWQFPVERAELEKQLLWLEQTGESNPAVQAFSRLSLSPELATFPWAQQPTAFVERLTAWLWSSHEIDAFHRAAADYGNVWNEFRVHSEVNVKRLCIVIVGRNAVPGRARLFEKLKPHGCYFFRVDPQNGLDHAAAALRRADAASPGPYRHWYVDGAAPDLLGNREGEKVTDVATLSFDRLTPVRTAVLKQMETARLGVTAGGPEALRSMMAQMRPDAMGTATGLNDEVMRHFALSLFTEGSGTQIFSTTFVQWTGREILRRARPQTLLLRYAPRQVARPMDALMRAEQGTELPDAQGSLIDADMGAYYTWINLMRLPGAESARFLAWFEGQREAIAISPSLAKATVSDQECSIEQILSWMA